MFSFFKKTKATQELDKLVTEIHMDMENNYKDLARPALEELKQNNQEVLSILPVVGDYKIVESISIIKENLNTEDEILVCEKLSTLKQLNALNDIDIDAIAKQITNSNIKAIIENLK